MSTNFQVGFVSQKNSSKVLKPPGGGSTDIFGGDVATTPRSIKNHMKSTIFAVPSPVSKTDNVRRQPADSHNRLFGDADRSCTPAKNRLKSNIPIGGDESDSSLKHSNGTNSSSREHVNGSENGKTNGGNSVNGDAFKTSGENIAPANHVINKNRIPPGGFSSGLW